MVTMTACYWTMARLVVGCLACTSNISLQFSDTALAFVTDGQDRRSNPVESNAGAEDHKYLFPPVA